MTLKPKFIPVYRHQPETLLYQTNLASLGISERSLQHVDKFVRDCKEAGVWSRLLEVATFTGSGLLSAAIKLKYQADPNLTLTNFVIGDYNEAAGLTGDGVTKFVNINFNASAMPAASHLAFYQRTDNAVAATRICLGANDATDDFWLGSLNPSAQTDARLGKAVTASGGGQMVRGFYYVERKSTTDLKVYRNNTQIAATATSATHAAPAFMMYAWARNNSGVAGGFNQVTGSFLSIGTDMSAQERADYHAIVQTLQINLGREV